MSANQTAFGDATGEVIRRWDLTGSQLRIIVAVKLDKPEPKGEVIVFCENPWDHICLGLLKVGDRVRVKYTAEPRSGGAFDQRHAYADNEVQLKKLDIESW